MPSMRISLGTLSSPASRFPLLLPGEPPFRAPYLAPLRTAGERVRMVTTAAAGERRRAGYVSVVERALAAEEEYRRARAEVQRKGVEVEGYGIEGISIGGHETCVIVPSLNVAFDIGRCPARAVHQDFLFITHAHLDHIGGLPMYVATRGLYSLKPPTIFLPSCIKEDVEKLFDIHRSMSQTELNLEIVAIDIGDTYEIRNNLVVRPFKTHHVIPSQITDTILSPEVAFTGDTTSDFILEPRNADALRAKVLITEATFLDEENDVEHARQHGHMHLSEIIANAQWFRNKAILLTHFSSRYKIEDIRQAIAKLQPKLSPKIVALTEGFRSAYPQ
ncbi:Ribonuclease Z protein [Dioscorea alata]|uniref:Ribonuclease Z protein n=1 Tax=Dioscorea alata TaxID=55571 RepID=A0ACB7VIV0_DIOAL|nr:Ribonuclease Z protein [Dioscorea alata]